MLKIQLKFYLIIGVVLVIGLILGYALGLFLGREKIYNQGLDQGKKEVEEKYQSKIKELYPAPPESEEVFSFFGEIKEIKDKILIAEAPLPAANPFEEPKIDIKTITTDSATEFVEVIQKSQAEMMEEREAILEAKKENPNLEIPIIELYKKERSILFSDFKVGDTIVAETEENIKGKTEFIAKKIRILILQPKIEQINQ